MFYVYLVLIISTTIFFFWHKKKFKQINLKLKRENGAQYEHIPSTIDYSQQSKVLDDSGATRTSIYGQLQVVNEKIVKHTEVYDDDVTTLVEMLEKGAQRSKG